jgi:hypothetical protein
MFILSALFLFFRSLIKPRIVLATEILALRQQLAVVPTEKSVSQYLLVFTVTPVPRQNSEYGENNGPPLLLVYSGSVHVIFMTILFS